LRNIANPKTAIIDTTKLKLGRLLSPSESSETI
jgi:hypothetical protein